MNLIEVQTPAATRQITPVAASPIVMIPGSTITLPTIQAVDLAGIFAVPTYRTTGDYAVDPGSAKVEFLYSTRKNLAGGFDVVDGKSATSRILIRATPASGIVPTRADITFRATIGRNRVVLKHEVSGISWTKDGYPIEQKALDEMAAKLVFQVNNSLSGFDANRPILVSEPVTITLKPIFDRPFPLIAVETSVDGGIILRMIQVPLDDRPGPPQAEKAEKVPPDPRLEGR